MFQKVKKWLRRCLVVVLIPFVCYGIYVLPVFLDYGGAHCLLDERKDGYHNDYVWGLVNFVKWSHTVVCGIAPPVQDLGSQDYKVRIQGVDHPKPIPLPGEWQISHTTASTRYWKVRMHYFAYTNRKMYHTRLGWRWDDVDGFFLFSMVPVKVIPYNWKRILWLHESRAFYRNHG